MGIPGLLTRIRPYALPIIWPKQEGAFAKLGDRETFEAIIDGPAFAHWIYRQLLPSNGNAFEAFPEYTDVASNAVAWLYRLEEHGVKVHRIFFDGYLPPAKESTRRERLDKSLRQLRAYRLAVPDARSQVNRTVDESQAGFERVQHRITKPRSETLPAAPFLVVSVLETLLTHSRFGHVCSVIPGEADLFCCDPVNCKPGNLILTSDTDIIVHSPHGCRVVFFDDMQISASPKGPATLQAFFYTRETVETGLKCNDLRMLAFLMRDSGADFLRDCTNRVKAEPHTEQFQEYVDLNSRSNSKLSLSVAESFGDRISDSTNLECLLRLDPRVSGFVLQCQRVPQRHHDVCMSLPFLLDDPTRASAWNASLDIRRLAYSLLCLRAGIASLRENDRRGERMTESSVTLYSFIETDEASSRLLAELPLPKDDREDVTLWRLWGAGYVLSQMHAEEKQLPSTEDVSRVFELTAVSNFIEWPQIHLATQVEAALYSIRMLKQILGVLLELTQGGDRSEFGFDRVQLERLHTTLASLPRLSRLLVRPGRGLPVTADVAKRFIQRMQEKYGMAAAELPNGGGERKRKKRKTNKSQITAESASKASANMYDLLGDM